MSADLTPISVGLAGVKHPLAAFKNPAFLKQWADSFRRVWHTAYAAEIRADASGEPRLHVWADTEERQGTEKFVPRIFSGMGNVDSSPFIIRLRNVRFHPRMHAGDHPRMAIQCRYRRGLDDFTGFVNNRTPDVRAYWAEVAQSKNQEGYLASMHMRDDAAPASMQERFIIKALAALGLSIRLAYRHDTGMWNFSFWDYNPRAMRDPAAAAGLYNTFIYRGDSWLGKLRSFEERFDGISPTAFTSIPLGNTRVLGVFGVDESIDGKMVLLTPTFRRRPDGLKVFPNSLIVSAITRQDTPGGGGPLYCLADSRGDMELFTIPDIGTMRLHDMHAGDVSSFYRLLLCFGRCIGLRAGGGREGNVSVVKLHELGEHRFEQQVLIGGLPGLMRPREFHSEEPRLLLDGPHGLRFSEPIAEVGRWYPEQTMPDTDDTDRITDFDVTILN